jgi:hypothetical protein
VTAAAHRAFAALATLLVLGAVAAGFALVGTPAARRLERLDERRLGELRATLGEVVALCRAGGAPPSLRRPLPATLDELAGQARGRRVARADPAGMPYGYRVLDERRLELCATFDQPRDADVDVFWNHPAGRHCFTIDVLDLP